MCQRIKIRRKIQPILRSKPHPANQTEGGNKFIAVDDASDTMYKIKRELSDKQKQALEQSTLSLRASQLYMHYWKEELDNSNRDDPEWRNTVMSFWRAEEPFPRKSLPPFFQQLPVRYFLFEQRRADLSLTSMQAVPWFNQPGGVTKYVCLKNGNEVTVPKLHDLGVIEYYEAVEQCNSHRYTRCGCRHQTTATLYQTNAHRAACHSFTLWHL